MNARRIYRASHLFGIPDQRDITEDGAIVVQDGIAIAAGRFRELEIGANDTIEDLGDGLLLPGLVNAHTHLEFSSLEDPVGEPGIEFTQWIRLVVATRQSCSTENKDLAIARGIQESIDSGVSLVGEIATAPCNLVPYNQSDLDTTVFLEQLGRNTATLDELKATRTSFLRSFDTVNSEQAQTLRHRSNQLAAGMSPHAPYSVGHALLRSLIDSSKQNRLPLAMHLAETEQERELLESLSGPFVNLLQEFGVWDRLTFQPPMTIQDYIQALAVLDRSLIIHGNVLRTEELDLVARHRDKMSVVFCPRTHQFFQHHRYPLNELLQRKINVAVGTDSRASNPDLKLFEELKMIAREFPEVDELEILRMGTRNGALALNRMGEGFGQIEPNLRARIAFIARPQSEGGPIRNWLFSTDADCVRVL
ncbi:MAG: amidohydrolase family protein [Planctomycetota bacterium]